MSAKQTPLAIVGIGCLFPKASSLQEFWANIKNRVDGITEVPATHWSPEDYFDADPKKPDMTYARRGGFLSPVPFDAAEFGISPNNLEATDAAQLMGLVAAQMALKDAGYGPEKEYDRSQVSVILGVTGTLELVVPLGARLGHPVWRKALAQHGITGPAAESIVESIKDGYVPWQENSFPGLLGNVVAGRIANRFNFGGTNCVVDAACGSSLSAAHLASLELHAGRSRMVVTGGVDCFNDIFMYMCFSKTPALSATGDAKPFDKKADGTILGEGVGMVVLKRLEDAEKDGDRIYAVLKGVGSSSDGRGKSIYAPSAEGQQKALRKAYEVAGVEPKTIGLVEAHGTGTTVGDGVEVDALKAVYGEAETPWCALGSVKSMIGHTKAAAGSAGIIKAALSLRHKVLPPTIKVTDPIPQLDKSPFYLSTEKRPWLRRGHPRRAAVSALGFGGANFHAVVEEHRCEKDLVDWDGEAQLVALSGDLDAALSAWEKPLSWDEVRVLAARARAAFDPKAEKRLCFVVSKGDDLPKLFSSIRAGLAKGQLPPGAYLGSGRPGKLGVLFSGQGSQYAGMGRDLSCLFPEAFTAVEEAEAALGLPLGDLMYPRPTLKKEEKDEQEKALRATECAQPALGAAGLGAWRVLRGFGVRADAFAGHSYGELPALCAAGVFDAATLYRLSRRRGELMAAGDGGRGGMVAVQAPLVDIEKVLSDEKLDLVVANKNAPSQTVLSGRKEETARAAEVFGKRGMRAVTLPVAAAFHSPLVAAAEGEFYKTLEASEFAAAEAPVYANKTAQPYPKAAGEARALLASQLASPVEFVKMIERMNADGVTTFVEVGAGARLAGLVGQILPGKAVSVAVDASGGKKAGAADLARALAQLAALGYPLELSQWEGGEEAVKSLEKKPGKMTVPLSGANNRTTKPKAQPKPELVRQSLGVTAAPAQLSARTVAPAAAPVTAADGSAVMLALQATQNGLEALQRMQEQTAQLHTKFLEAQELSHSSFQSLVEQQQRLMAQMTGVPLPQGMAAMPAMPLNAPLPGARRPQGVEPRPAPPAENRAEPARKPGVAVEPVLLSVVSEKTGYPPEMLNLDMDLESDLGIDSIKRVEIMSAMTEKLPGAPKVKPEHLGTLRTLKQIIAFLSEGMGAAAPAAARTETYPQEYGIRTAVDNSAVQSTLLAVVSEKTGYPPEMLNLDMDLESDLGIDSIKRVEIMSAMTEKLPGAPKVKPEHLGTLRTLKQIIAFLSEGMAAAPAAGPGTVHVNSGVDGSAVQPLLLQVVSEKTGYPPEMLNLDMDLESDLGIDSIKRVEIMSAMTEKLPGAPKVKPEHLGTLRTLKQIIGFLSEGMAAAAPADSARAESVDKSSGAAVEPLLLAVVSEKTGYPPEMLNLDMDLESDLGIDSIKRVEIMSAMTEKLPGAPKVKPEHLGTLRTLRQIISFLSEGRSASGAPRPQGEEPRPAPPAENDAEPARPLMRQVLRSFPVAEGRKTLSLDPAKPIWITDDGSSLAPLLASRLEKRGLSAKVVSVDAVPAPGEPIAGLVILGEPRLLSPSKLWPERSEKQMKSALMLAQRCAPFLQSGALLATVSRLDGSFGLSGLTLEQDPVYGALAGLSKTAAREWPEARCKAVDLACDWEGADAAEALAAELLLDGPVEAGLSASGTKTLALEEVPQEEEDKPLALQPGGVVVVTGGARGVTVEACASIAHAKPTLVLLGRTAPPEPEEAWVAACRTELELKRAIAERLGASAAPRVVGARAAEALAAREVRAQLARLEALGAKVVYRACDVREGKEVAALMAALRKELGPVRGIIHGAGVLADKKIADKTADGVTAVLGTKLGGLRHLLSAVELPELRFLALFSSTTARFGRVGQVDYAMANEALNKAARLLSRRLPDCRVVSFGWGPWDGGMVTPAIKGLFASEGIGLIGLEQGGRFLARELASSSRAVEVVVLGRAAAPAAAGPSGLGAVFERKVSLSELPVLRSHVIAGRAVLPTALMVEWLAHAALHGNPGLRFQGVQGLRVYKGVRVREGEEYALSALAGKAAKQGKLFAVRAELRGPGGVLHAGADVLLAATAAKAPGAEPVPSLPAYKKGVERAYSEVLFHGPELRAIRAVSGCGEGAIVVEAAGSPAPSSWMRAPLRDHWLADPMALDAAFQAMILWSRETRGAPNLPSALGSYTQYGRFPSGGCRVVCRVARSSEGHAAADIDLLDAHGALIARLEGFECTIEASLSEAFRRNAVEAAS